MPALTEECIEIAASDDRRPRRGRLRIFRSPVLEALFRSPPWVPFVWVPLLVGLCLEHGTPPPGRGALFFGGGWLLWWLLEVAMHRFFFHLPGQGKVARGMRFIVHEHHHAFPHDPGRLVATPWQSALALALLAAVARLVGPGWLTILAGSACAYLFYEAIHWRIHHDPGGGRFIRRLRAHHLRHHAKPEAGYGISIPV
jgi:hypothetical protein